VAWLCLLTGQGGRRWAGVLAGGAIGLGAGFRSELAPFLTPLWLYACLAAPGSRRQRTCNTVDALLRILRKIRRMAARSVK
jgi:hypothetical protein